MPIYIVSGEMTENYHPFASAIVEAVTPGQAIAKVEAHQRARMAAARWVDPGWPKLLDRADTWEAHVWSGDDVRVFPNGICDI